MRISSLAATLSLLATLTAQDPADTHASPKDAFVRFQQEAGGEWRAQWHPATGTPSAIWGTGLKLADWRENSLAEARRHANLLLTERTELLGLGASEFREIIGARMGRTWSFTFDQFFRGLPVIEGRADVRINMIGTVAMFGSRAFPIPADFDVTPAIDADLATAIAWAKLEEKPTSTPQPGRARKPQLVIWGDIAAPSLAPVSLAWEVAVSNVDANGGGTIGRYYVDAKSGAVLHFTNDKHQCSPGCTNKVHTRAADVLPVLTTVTVTAWTRTGNDAFSALVNTPLRGIVLNVPGVGNVTTDVNGQFTVNIASPVTINVAGLDGTHFSPILGANAPTGSFVVNPGVATTIQLLTAGATTNEAAHPTAAYWIDRTNEWARSILGNTAQLATLDAIVPTVNIATTCNAYYTGNTVNYYTAGGGCSNTAFSTVIAHEWGHGLDDQYGGISNATGDGLSEGWGDIIGMYLVDSPLLGSGFQTQGVALRNGVNTRTYPQTGVEIHTAGMVWMGFAWELRTRLKASLPAQTAIDVSNDIVISSIVADATNQVDAVREVFIADDDDGNLLNGVPHYTELSGAANAKLLPFPQQVFGTISHIPLTSTNERLVPRMVTVTAIPAGGTFTQVRLHYNVGAGNLVRNMQSTGPLFGYRALLPGRLSGSVSYHIEAVHNTGAIVRYPASGEVVYTIDPAQGAPFNAFYTENFESGAVGWTSFQVATQNDWQVGDPAGKSGTSGGIAWADPQVAGGGVNCYGNDLGNTIAGTTWNGSYGTNVENYTRTPVINCTGHTGVRLRFKRWLTIEDGLYDQATLLVNGQVVWSNPTGSNVVDTSWQTVEYALPMADNNPSVQIEWHLKSDGGVQLGGWNIDDVQLGTVTMPPLDVQMTMLPEQQVQNGTMALSIQTPAPNHPWFLMLGDTGGPISVPGLPTLFIGGAVWYVSGVTDGTGNTLLLFQASPTSDTAGTLLYSQVLTLDPTFTQWVVSNPFVNMFTVLP